MLGMVSSYPFNSIAAISSRNYPSYPVHPSQSCPSWTLYFPWIYHLILPDLTIVPRNYVLHPDYSNSQYSPIKYFLYILFSSLIFYIPSKILVIKNSLFKYYIRIPFFIFLWCFFFFLFLSFGSVYLNISNKYIY